MIKWKNINPSNLICLEQVLLSTFYWQANLPCGAANEARKISIEENNLDGHALNVIKKKKKKDH